MAKNHMRRSIMHSVRFIRVDCLTTLLPAQNVWRLIILWFRNMEERSRASVRGIPSPKLSAPVLREDITAGAWSLLLTFNCYRCKNGVEFYLYSLYAPWSARAEIFLHPFVGMSNEGLKKVDIEIGTSQTRRGRPGQTRPDQTRPDQTRPEPTNHSVSKCG